VAASPGVANVLRFGVFELDIANSELRRAGVLIKLTPQQYRLLHLLASHAGEILSRAQIQREIWEPGTFVDFDRSLNVCVAQLRAALNDDSENARFIETVPRRGYRFIAPVLSDVPNQRVPSRRGWILAVGIALIGGVVASYFTARIVGTTNGVRLAVLPFESLDQDARDDPVLDGLTEELISDFGSLQPARLGVIGRSSVMRYKGAAPGLDRIGRELRVSYVVEGSLRRNSGRVRLTARLLRVRDQLQVWTETFEQDDSNLFDMQEDAAARITAGVLRRLFPESKVETQSAQTRNRDAYQAYINGQYLEHKNSLDDLRRSAAYFAEAARLDPAFAEAQAALASAYVGLGRSGAGDAEVFDRAKAAAENALRLDNSSATAHNALANALFWHEWNWTEAERHFSRAIAINPSFPLGHHDYAFYLVAMGRTEEGISSLRRAMALDPLSTRVNMDAGWLLLQAHRFDQAIEQAKRALALEPGLEEANACIARAKEYQGRSDADSVKRLRAMLDRRDQIEPFSYATACALTGEKAKALDALERAYAARSSMMPLLKTEPSFAKLHSEPRFQALATRLHFP
jgi:TolB-like protein/DNA-binding winged helix-turn-helix (wHTH) protein